MSRRLEIGPVTVIGGLLSLSLLIFVFYKSAVTSFTHDESFTTLHFFPQPELDILFYRHPFTSVITNNHIFNTFLMKLSESIFGMREWALRLPNVLALLVYMVYGYSLCRRSGAHWVQLGAFLLLLANPYLLDFFGLARGYGLSVGMMTGSLYYLLAFLEQRKGRRLLGFHVMAILAVMSNFALLNFYVAAIGCLYLLPLLQRRGGASFLRHWSFHVWNATALLLLSGLLYAPFKVIWENHTVSFGGKNGFFSDTVLSVVRRSLYETELPEAGVKAIGIIICVSVVLPFGLVLWKLIRRSPDFFMRHAALFVCNTLCWLIALMTIVQHHWFGQDYLEDRFAIFLYPLLALNVIFAIRWLADDGRFKQTSFFLLGMISALMIVHTASKLNTEYYLNWKYDKDTKAAMSLLRSMKPGSPDAPQWKIGIFHKLEPTMNLYRQWWQMDWIQRFDREPPEASDDLVFMPENELEQFGIASDGKVLFRSPETGLILMKK